MHIYIHVISLFIFLYMRIYDYHIYCISIIITTYKIIQIMENSSQEIELTKDEYELELRKKTSQVENYKNCMELIQQQYFDTKEELNENKKELETKSNENKLLKTKNNQLKSEINSLKAKITDLTVELTDAKNLIENEKKYLQLLIPKPNEFLNDQLKKELNEWKQKNFLLKLEYEKAVSYAADYVNKLKIFEDNLRQVVNERNELSESLKISLTKFEELKAQNNELVATCANKQIQINRLTNSHKQQKTKEIELNKQLRDTTNELNKLKLKCKQYEEEINQVIILVYYK
jgi:chromosome segregation ATPase